jgi:hypothetical protein
MLHWTESFREQLLLANTDWRKHRGAGQAIGEGRQMNRSDLEFLQEKLTE